MAPLKMLFIALAVVFSVILHTSTGDDAPNLIDDEVASLVELMELDYVDVCQKNSEAEWEYLLNPRKSENFDIKMEQEKEYGQFVREQSDEVKVQQSDDPVLIRKLDLIAKPGDPLLMTDQWNKLVSFRENAEHTLLTATNIDCYKNKPQNCTTSEFLKVLATSKDRHLLSSAKSSWEMILPDEKKYASEILPLLINATKSNGFVNVEDYWEMLVEYENAFEKAEQLWNDIQPLYQKLQKFVYNHIAKQNGSLRDDGSIPSHWLGSLFGDDWSNIAKSVMPNLSTYNKINNHLVKKNVGGKNAFKYASRMLHKIGLGELNDKFWKNSKFDGTCPTKVINLCKEKILKAYTCSDVSISNFMDIHDVAMSVQHRHKRSEIRANTYILTEPNRISALDEAISGLGSIIAMSSQNLNAEGIISSDFQSDKANDEKVTLQLLIALRDLPRLAYYYTADKWRLMLIKNAGAFPYVGNSWSQLRRNITLVSPSDRDFLGDSYILSNKPYIAKFLGGILKYQIFELLTSDIYEEEDDIMKLLITNSLKLQKTMEGSYRYKWPIVTSEKLDIRDINADSLIDYFQPLSDFLSVALDSNPPSVSDMDSEPDNQDIDLNEFKDEDNDFIEENTDLNNEIKVPETEIATEKQNSKNIHSFDNFWSSNNESSTNLAYNPYLIPKDMDGGSPAASSDTSNAENRKDESIDAASLQYAWIALGVLALLIVMLAIVIIARKRYKHKKELERERRQGP